MWLIDPIPQCPNIDQDNMNSLFRSARRALSWGLLATLSLVLLVLAKGVNSEFMMAFRMPPDEAAAPAEGESEAPDEQPPEHFAQAESNTRLDVAGAQSASPSPGRSQLNAQPDPPQDLIADGSAANSVASDVVALSPPAGSASEESATADQAGPGPVFELPPPPDFTEEPPAAVAARAPKSTSPMGLSAAANAVGSAVPVETDKPASPPGSEFVAQLAALQAQLDRMAAAQEAHQTTQQTWLESHYQQHQEQLEKKLAGIEAGLKELQHRSDQLSSLAKDGGEPVTPRAMIKRGDRTVTSLSDVKLSAPSVVRDVLDSLGDQSHLNLNLSINVAGDMAMSLQDPKSRGSVEPPPQPSGYIVGKDGRKTHITSRPAAPSRSEDYLPPIVKHPDSQNPR